MRSSPARRPRPFPTRTLCSALALAGLCTAAAAQPTGPLNAPLSAAAARERLVPLEVIVNGVNGGGWTLLERDGMLYAPVEAFDEWRVTRRPGSEPYVYRGQTFIPLGAVPGFEARMNYANQSVELVFSPQAFAATRLKSEGVERAPTSPVEPAFFMNFDANFSATNRRSSTDSRDLGVLTELGYASDLGVLTSSFVARNLTSADPALKPTGRRLETTFTRDFPQSNVTLKLGDTTTRPSMWGQAVYFGGIQLARNFGLTPGFVTQPIPVISGTSSAPSTVELYINDSLRQTSAVPPGPFVIDNFPLLTGSGQARLVVRDVLGRETVITQPFFTSSNLLDEGLSDWSVEAGATRLNLGANDSSYDKRFGAGMYRYGLTPRLTGEARLEVMRDLRNAGVGATYSLPFQLLGQAAIALSDTDNGRGRQWILGLDHDDGRHLFNTRIQRASRDYRQLGRDALTLPNRTELSASYTYSTDDFGALGVALARIETYDRGTLSTYSANYSMKVGQRSSLTFNATRVTGSSSGTSVGMYLTVPLDSQRVASASASRKTGKLDAYTSVTQGLPAETGVGWRVLGGVRQDDPYSEGSVYYQGNRALLTADASASRDQQSLRLGAQGAFVFVDGKFFASRRVDSSFALVEVAGYPNVGVGFQGTPLTRTDEAGYALLPRLLPYQKNSIRLDPSELPISAEIDNIEQVAVPAARSGVKVTFPVRSGRGALIKIVLDDGEPAPAGAPLELVGDTKEFFVARRGEAFVTGLQARNTLRLKWNGATCTFAVELPPGNQDEIARVGPVACRGVARSK